MPIAVQAIAVVGGSVLVALAGLALVRRRVGHEALTGHTDVAGFVYATLGVVYGVILAGVVVAAWEEYAEGRAAADAEANAALDLFRLAEGLPQPDRGRVEAAILAYVRSAIDAEWPAMARGEAPSPDTVARMVDLWRVYTELEQGAAGGTARYAASLDELDELDDARGTRLLAGRETLPPLMWATLIAGAALTVGFAYVFGVENAVAHALMVGALAAMIALNLFLIRALDAPFQGAARVPPHALERVLRLAEQEAGTVLDPFPGGPVAAAATSS